MPTHSTSLFLPYKIVQTTYFHSHAYNTHIFVHFFKAGKEAAGKEAVMGEGKEAEGKEAAMGEGKAMQKEEETAVAETAEAETGEELVEAGEVTGVAETEVAETEVETEVATEVEARAVGKEVRQEEAAYLEAMALLEAAEAAMAEAEAWLRR